MGRRSAKMAHIKIGKHRLYKIPKWQRPFPVRVADRVVG